MKSDYPPVCLLETTFVAKGDERVTLTMTQSPANWRAFLLTRSAFHNEARPCFLLDIKQP